MNLSRASVLRLWGGLDIFHVLWYSLHSWKLGHVPYVTDFTKMVVVSEQWGGALFYGLMSWGLQLSIVLTGVLFVLAYRPARYLGFVQIPLRLLFLVPSIPLLLSGVSDWPVLIVLAFALSIEAFKGWSLWKYA